MLSPDGAGFTAVTDQGRWLTGALSFDADGRLTGISGGELAPLLMPDGTPVRGTPGMRDAEALTRLDDGSLLVGFEQRHRIWRYRSPSAVAEAYLEAPEFAQLPGNGGIEAMARLAGGGLLLLSEGARNGNGDNLGWLWHRGKLAPLSYVTEGTYVPTDVARLSGGDLLVLERRFNPFTGFGARLVRIAGAAVAAGARLQGEELARIEWPYLVENYEAVAATPAVDGGHRVYLVSDDNFSPFQSTLLLQFYLPP